MSFGGKKKEKMNEDWVPNKRRWDKICPIREDRKRVFESSPHT